MSKYVWLPHLKDVVPKAAQGDKLSMYAIALEGWRRGLTLKFFNVKSNGKWEVNYSLSSETKEHKFAVSKGDLVTVESMKISKNKMKTKQLLEASGVAVPLGVSFNENVSDNEIIEYAESKGYPVVLKPTDGNLGKGVIANIKNSDQLKEALKYVRKELKFKKVILETFINGEEYRVYVIGDKVIGATNRIPANVIGDGENSIKRLIDKKNKDRKKNPNLSSRLIKVDKQVEQKLKNEGITLNYVPRKKERIFLNDKSNISSGGDPIDATDILTDAIKATAVNAAKAVNMVQCGVDVLFDKEKNIHGVIELNSRPGIGAHLFPMEGIARDIPKEVVDFYFPETTGSSIKLNAQYYFDFDHIYNLLKSRIVEEIVVPPAPNEELRVSQFLVYGKVQGVGYRQWIQKKAVNLGLHGTVENLPSGEVSIVASGTEKVMKEFVQFIGKEKPKNADIEDIEQHPWTKPIKIGFEILENNSEESKKLKKQINDLKKKNKMLIEEKKKFEKEKKKAEQKYKSIINSKAIIYSKKINSALKKLKLK